MKKCQINRSREVRHHLPHRPLSGVDGNVRSAHREGRPCFVRQISRRRPWCQEDDVLKQWKAEEKSGYRDGAGRISKKMCISGMGQLQLHQDAVRRTAAMSVNSDAVVQVGSISPQKTFTQLAASLAHGRLRCAGWLGGVALAYSSLLCSEGLVP